MNVAVFRTLLVVAMLLLQCICDVSRSARDIYEIQLAQVQNVSVNARWSDDTTYQNVKLL
jgi:hypothetical protein